MSILPHYSLTTFGVLMRKRSKFVTLRRHFQFGPIFKRSNQIPVNFSNIVQSFIHFYENCTKLKIPSEIPHLYTSYNEYFQLMADSQSKICLSINFCDLFSVVFVVQRLSHLSNTQKVPGSIPGENSCPTWSNGQDIWLSPRGPGFNSRRGKTFYRICFL